MDKNILIVGGGAMGTFVKKTLEEKGTVAYVFDTQKERSEITEEAYPRVFEEADVIFLCVASEASAALLLERGATCKEGACIVALAKGLASDGVYMHEIIEARAPRARAVLIAGPLLAIELMEHKHTHAVIASKNQEASAHIAELIGTEWLTCTQTDDVAGVALASVLKNCYTMLLGIAEGCALGENGYGILCSRAIQEMEMLILKEGGKRETVFGPAGIADLIASSKSLSSRNHLCGLTLGKEGACAASCEGARSARILASRFSALPPLVTLLTVLLQDPTHASAGLIQVIHTSHKYES